MEACRSIAVILTYKKSNKNQLEHRADDYRSTREKHPIHSYCKYRDPKLQNVISLIICMYENKINHFCITFLKFIYFETVSYSVNC
jgi:hypothetical protein